MHAADGRRDTGGANGVYTEFMQTVSGSDLVGHDTLA
jgi:hypothetical protein